MSHIKLLMFMCSIYKVNTVPTHNNHKQRLDQVTMHRTG